MKNIALKISKQLSKKDIKDFESHTWDIFSFLLCQKVAFRAKDKELLIKAFPTWFDEVIKKYGKSRFIECVIICRLEPKK